MENTSELKRTVEGHDECDIRDTALGTYIIAAYTNGYSESDVKEFVIDVSKNNSCEKVREASNRILDNWSTLHNELFFK